MNQDKQTIEETDPGPVVITPEPAVAKISSLSIDETDEPASESAADSPDTLAEMPTGETSEEKPTQESTQAENVEQKPPDEAERDSEQVDDESIRRVDADYLRNLEQRSYKLRRLEETWVHCAVSKFSYGQIVDKLKPMIECPAEDFEA